MDSGKIKPTFEIIGGKKVPVYKIPTGMSGLTPEAKAELETKISGKESIQAHDKSAPVRLDKLLDEGDMDSEEVESYLNEMDASLEVSSLFDSANVE